MWNRNIVSSSSSILSRNNNNNNNNGGNQVMINGLAYSHSSYTYTLESFVDEMLKSRLKKVVVMTGAGISTASGIPDFRTPGTGLYYNLNKFNIPYPEAIFEKDYFRRNPRPFFTLAKDLLPNIEKYKPNKIHYFLRLLQEKNILHRVYTQNIDGLECLSGIDPRKLVEAHGSFRSAKCIECNRAYSGIYIKNEIQSDRIPQCRFGKCSGLIKPDIVFFGEDLPDVFYRMYELDFSMADCIIIMGTSLKVEPFSNLIEQTKDNIPRLLLNKESVGPFKSIKYTGRKKDLQLLGDLIRGVDSLVEKLGWKDELDELILREQRNIELLKDTILEEMYYKYKHTELTREKNLILTWPEKPEKPPAKEVNKTEKVEKSNTVLPKQTDTLKSENAVIVKRYSSFDHLSNKKPAYAASLYSNSTYSDKKTTSKPKKKKKVKKVKAKKKKVVKDVDADVVPQRAPPVAIKSQVTMNESNSSDESDDENEKENHVTKKRNMNNEDSDVAVSDDDDDENEDEEANEFAITSQIEKIQSLNSDFKKRTSNENSETGSNSSSSSRMAKQHFVQANDKRLFYNRLGKDYMSNLIKSKYSIHVKLIDNFNKYNELFKLNETSGTGQQQQPATRPNRIQSTFGGSQHELTLENDLKNLSLFDGAVGAKASRFEYKNRLLTANSKPLLMKRVQSAATENV